MFDDQPTTSQSPVDEIIQSTSSPSNPTNTGPSVVPDAFKPKEENKEPEDIFGASDPITSPATQPQPASLNVTDDVSTDEAAEPAIKNAPSAFKKLASTPIITKTPPNNPTPPPMPTTAPANNKNIIIFIILILIILGLAAAAYWFFILKDKTPPVTENNPIELFKDQPLNTNTEIPSEKEKQDNNNSNPQEQDTDGDGLYDEAEILLGTSINSSDTDNDGLSDKDEVKIHKTDPLKQDSDNDGWIDSEEIIKGSDPLKEDSVPQSDGHYVNNQYKLSFNLLPDMVFESANGNILQFNDNVNQIKFYIYLAGSHTEELTPDVQYTISEDQTGNLIIQGSQQKEDLTPYSTDLNTINYQANNGLTYLMRYVATKRADNHLENFEQLLNSFNFKK